MPESGHMTAKYRIVQWVLYQQQVNWIPADLIFYGLVPFEIYSVLNNTYLPLAHQSHFQIKYSKKWQVEEKF